MRRRAERVIRPTRKTRRLRVGGHDLLTQADAGCPAGQVMRHHLDRQPGAVGGDAVLEVAYGVLEAWRR